MILFLGKSNLSLKVSLCAHFFILQIYLCALEIVIFTDTGFIEIISVVMLILCLLRCGQFAWQSRAKEGRYFWLASVLVFFAVIRRELNHLSDLLVPSDFMLLGYTYDWWEDGILLMVYVSLLGLLIYAWRYLWAVLKRVPIWLYISVAGLALVQYLSENAVYVSEGSGEAIEETTEVIIYAIALVYLYKMKLTDMASSFR